GDMTILEFLILLLVAAICGGIAQALVGFSRGGCLVSTAVGLIGALIGYWLAGTLGLPLVIPLTIGGETFPIIWSIIGAVLFVGVVSLFTSRR
ncbi:MAG: GlsB/YeaQ/YmgE family stress response membrane protein, partial [Anaerolineae bacterium]